MADDSGAELERTRAELRRLGYLDHGLERFLLQDALRPRQPLRTLAVLTAKVGLLAGPLLAAALAVTQAAANGSLQASPLDLPVLFLHLLVPLSAAAAAAFLVLGSAALLVLRLYHVRRVEAVALAVSLTAGLGGLALALWEARAGLAQGGAGQAAALAALVAGAAVAAYALVRLVYQGLLALAIRFSPRAPAGSLLVWRWRRWVSGAVLAGVLLVAVPVVLAARPGTPALPPLLPVGPGEPALVLGLDGVLPEEADYLLDRGELPTMAALAKDGGRLLTYRRPEGPPAAFWTSVATGLPAGRHGVAALDSFLPLGVRTPLARSGLLRPYWQHVEVPLHLAEYRPVLANRRSAFTFWELAARGGQPVLAVDWWATFPASPLPGLVIAHDAFQLLQEGASGAVSDPAAAPALLSLLRGVAGHALASADAGPARAAAAGVAGGAAAGAPDTDAATAALTAALTATPRRELEDRALRPDAFYRAAFAARLDIPPGASRGTARDPAGKVPLASASISAAPPASPTPRAAALYLPGLDIAAADWRGGDLALGDLVRGELRAADRLLREALARPGWGIVVVVLDPGRRRRGGGSASGRVLLWRRGPPCRGGGAETTPEAVTAAILRTLGLPQSAELPPPAPQCVWPEPPARVERYGRPPPPSLPGAAADPASAAEYLQNLRSLGYL